MTKRQGKFADNLTSLPQFGSYGMQSWTTAKNHIFLILMLQLLSNFSLEDQGKARYNYVGKLLPYL